MTAKNPASSTPEANPAKKKIKLALQGGGAHGAFTWGVLDRLLEDPRIEIEAVVGTSAGAMNAAVTACGLITNGPEGARALLSKFWHEVSKAGKSGPLQPSQLDKMTSRGNMTYSPMFHFFDFISKIYSPYELNPNNVNPLKDIVQNVVNFDAIHGSDAVKLFVCATNVLSGRLKVFSNNDITPDAVMASACLPHLFQAVEIDGEYFWDGGYSGNPPIFPLMYPGETQDILLIQIEPTNIADVPRTSAEIIDRIKTLSFNSNLIRELRAINFVTSLIDSGELDSAKYPRIFMHTIDAEVELGAMAVSSKLNSDMEFLTHLFKMGRQKASRFLELHYKDIGHNSSTDIARKFM